MSKKKCIVKLLNYKEYKHGTHQKAGT